MDEIGIESARRVLGEIVDKARFTGEPTLIARQGKPAAVIVNYDWYQQAKAPEKPAIVDGAEEFGFGRNAAPPWEEPAP